MKLFLFDCCVVSVIVIVGRYFCYYTIVSADITNIANIADIANIANIANIVIAVIVIAAARNFSIPSR